MKALGQIDSARWYHGGPSKAAKCGWILPADVAGIREKNPFSRTYQADCVFVTTDIDLAIQFAAKVAKKGGAVFEVQPVGELELDAGHAIDGEGEAYTCDRARIIRKANVPGKALKRARKKWTEVACEMLREGVFDETGEAAEERICQVAEQLAERRVARAN